MISIDETTTIASSPLYCSPKQYSSNHHLETCRIIPLHRCFVLRFGFNMTEWTGKRRHWWYLFVLFYSRYVCVCIVKQYEQVLLQKMKLNWNPLLRNVNQETNKELISKNKNKNKGNRFWDINPLFLKISKLNGNKGCSAAWTIIIEIAMLAVLLRAISG